MVERSKLNKVFLVFILWLESQKIRKINKVNLARIVVSYLWTNTNDYAIDCYSVQKIYYGL